MKAYRVVWAIDLEAESPEDAARQALAIHRDPGSTAVVFDIHDPVSGALIKIVDLEDVEDGEDVADAEDD